MLPAFHFLIERQVRAGARETCETGETGGIWGSREALAGYIYIYWDMGYGDMGIYMLGSGDPHFLVMAPTRELAVQIEEEAVKFGRQFLQGWSCAFLWAGQMVLFFFFCCVVLNPTCSCHGFSRD